MNPEIQEKMDKAIQDIAANHRKIIDDWCKAYMAQLYEEGHSIKPGDFTLNEQVDFVLSNGKLGKRYWFERGVPDYSHLDKEALGEK